MYAMIAIKIFIDGKKKGRQRMKTEKVNKILYKIVEFIDSPKTIATVYILIFFSLILVIALRIYVLIIYGNTPVTEMPVWVFWIMGGK